AQIKTFPAASHFKCCQGCVEIVTASKILPGPLSEPDLETGPPYCSNGANSDIDFRASSESELSSDQESSGECDESSQAGSTSDDSSHSSDHVQQLLSADINQISEQPLPSTATQSDSIHDFRRQLQTWAISHNVTHECLTDLLKIQRTHPCFAALPACARTLLQTPRISTGITKMGGGQYHHFGLALGLEQNLQNV
ncbi:unnamed protein product, partial [Ixodes hexagonus]